MTKRIMNYDYRSPNELLGILYKLIDQRFSEWEKITITHNKDTLDLRFDCEVVEK